MEGTMDVLKAEEGWDKGIPYPLYFLFWSSNICRRCFREQLPN